MRRRLLRLRPGLANRRVRSRVPPRRLFPLGRHPRRQQLGAARWQAARAGAGLETEGDKWETSEW